MKDKKVMYALIGGAAVLIGAAIYYSMNKDKASSPRKSNPLDDELAKLGPAKYESNGMHIEFDYFIKMYEISQTYAKKEFAKRKADFV